MESTEVEKERKCKCTGIRYCNYCKDADVRSLIKELYPLDGSLQILTYRCSDDSNICTSELGPSTLAELDFSGFHVFSEFITEDNE